MLISELLPLSMFAFVALLNTYNNSPYSVLSIELTGMDFCFPDWILMTAVPNSGGRKGVSEHFIDNLKYH